MGSISSREVNTSTQKAGKVHAHACSGQFCRFCGSSGCQWRVFVSAVSLLGLGRLTFDVDEEYTNSPHARSSAGKTQGTTPWLSANLPFTSVYHSIRLNQHKNWLIHRYFLEFSTPSLLGMSQFPPFPHQKSCRSWASLGLRQTCTKVIKHVQTCKRSRKILSIHSK